MKPHEIRAQLMLKQVTQRQIARQLGVSDAAVSQVVSGSEKNPRIRQAIAAALEVPVHQIWPQKTA